MQNFKQLIDKCKDNQRFSLYSQENMLSSSNTKTQMSSKYRDLYGFNGKDVHKIYIQLLGVMFYVCYILTGWAPSQKIISNGKGILASCERYFDPCFHEVSLTKIDSAVAEKLESQTMVILSFANMTLLLLLNENF